MSLSIMDRIKTSTSTDDIKQNETIPLLIKKYDGGKLTSNLFKS